MNARQACNLVYAHLTAGADRESRDKFDADLYEPVEGWQAAERAFFTRLDAAAGAGG